MAAAEMALDQRRQRRRGVGGEAVAVRVRHVDERAARIERRRDKRAVGERMQVRDDLDVVAAKKIVERRNEIRRPVEDELLRRQLGVGLHGFGIRRQSC